MINNYYYNQQLKKFIIAFANIFTGLKVRSGNTDCGIIEMEVPVRYGSVDRVVASLGAHNTQNAQHTLPIMSAYMTGIEPTPDRLKGLNGVDRKTYLKQGGVFPDDVKSIHRIMPIPYDLQMELSIYASNTDQMYQILEQLLLLFDYDLQIQFNDSPFDWAKISSLYLLGIANEENYPIGVDRRVLVWTLSFALPVWLSPPYDVRNEIIKKIKLRIGDMDKLTLDEVDQNGELVPFTTDGVYIEDTIEPDET